jgi:hypothetical protein
MKVSPMRDPTGNATVGRVEDRGRAPGPKRSEYTIGADRDDLAIGIAAP